MRAWEETGIAGSVSRRLSSFPGLLHLCAAPLLECVRGVSGEGSPSTPVMSTGLKLLGGNFCMASAGLYAVFGGARGSGNSSGGRWEMVVVERWWQRWWC